MRRALVVLAALAAVVSACNSGSPAKTLALIGSSCHASADCNSGNCSHGVCTRDCSVQGDCPTGFDCGLADPKDSTSSCLKASWKNPAQGGYGTNCAVSAGGCGGENPCANGFSCLYAAACDAAAYCTTSCQSDRDCPPTFFCGVPDATKPTERVCLKRTECTPCATDDQCPLSDKCATDKNGEHYCAKTCSSDSDCPRPEKDQDSQGNIVTVGDPFETCAADPGGKGKVCQPIGGVCHGPSTLPHEAAGQICSPCREGEPSDCQSGYACFEADTGERYCTIQCQVTINQYSNGLSVDPDSCPTGTYCAFGGLTTAAEECSSLGGYPCKLQGVCNADWSYQDGYGTCYPLPQSN